MNRNITLKGNNLIEKKELKPKLKTLDFLKQFARVYYAEKDLPVQINGTILN